MWSTFNEPLVIVELGYLVPFAGYPPGVYSPEGAARSLLNIVVAHARAYDAIKRWDRVKADKDSSEPAHVGIIHNIIPAYPLDSSRDSRAAELYDYLHNRFILNAVARGKLDASIDGESQVDVPHLGSRLDWLGVNYYSRIVVRSKELGDLERRYLPVLRFEGVEGYGYACIPNGLSREGRPCDDYGWELYPEGLRDAIEIARSYSLPIYVTEHGVADSRDLYRPIAIVSHVAVLEDLIEAGADVRGYLHWALTDNYEWSQGFRLRFGLYEVDLITKERRPRPSAFIYAKIASANTVPKDLRIKYLSTLHINVRESTSSRRL